MMKSRLGIVLILLLFISLSAHAQTDKEFWFVAPAVTRDHNPGGGQPVFFNFTNVLDTICFVTVEMPANSAFNDTTLILLPNTSFKFIMNYGQIANEYDNLGGVLGKSNKGFHITSTSQITVYFEYSNSNNPDIWALKGKNGLGTEFYTCFQTHMYNQNNAWSVQAYSAFDIVASEDNTIITINTAKNIYGHFGETSFTVTLNKGQTYSGAPYKTTVPPNGWKASDIFGRAGADHLSGVYITSSKPITVSIKDDSMKALGAWGCYDLGGDQTIPVNIAGKQYIAMKGQLSETMAIIQERVYVVGTQNNDSVFINGVATYSLAKGQTVMHQLVGNSTHIRTKFPSYVLQISGFGCEMGYAVLPAIDKCTGSYSVSFVRSSTDGMFLNLMVRAGAENDFKVYVNGILKPGLINGASFAAIPGTTAWKAARLGSFTTAQFPVNTAIRVENSKDLFHLGLINGGAASGTRYGYFSDYGELDLNVEILMTGSQYARGCDNTISDTAIALNAYTPQANKYIWTPSDFLSDPTSPTPYSKPPETILYKVKAFGACNMVDSATVSIEVYKHVEADFTIDKTLGCSPLNVTYNSRLFRTRESRWDFGNSTKEWSYADTVTFDTSFVKTYINNSLFPQTYNLQQIVYSKNDCTDTLKRSIIVYPNITAEFDVPDTMDCHPFSVQFTNNSYGQIDSNGYFWNFGNNNNSKKKDPLHIFYNYGDNDTSFDVTLFTVSPYGCRDTADTTITVHPIIDVKFTTDTPWACAEHTSTITNHSFGVDTFYINFGDGHDTILRSFNTIKHTYYNTDTLPAYDTIIVSGRNKEGCIDSMMRIVRILPKVIADFNFAPTNGCDSIVVAFNNLSEGYMLNYYWQFGNNNTSQLTNPVQQYLNKTGNTINFPVTLSIKSKYLCRDTITAIIPVYPYIRANFAIDTVLGCAPFNINITNLSEEVDTYKWNFGDGNISSSSAAQINHLYQNNSYNSDTNFLVRLSVANNEGCRDTMEQNVTIFSQIKASFYPDIIASCDPARFVFKNTSEGANSIIWDFGDNTTSAKTDTTVHIYPRNLTASPINYTVNILATASNNSCTSTADTIITVYPYNYTEFSISDYIGCPPFTTTFKNASIGAGNSYKWFINGTQAVSAPTDISDFVSTFQNSNDSLPLKYIIRLESKNNQFCNTFYEDTIAVYPKITAVFTSPVGYNSCSPLNISFNNTSTHANIYKWDFGDQTNSAQTSPLHAFKNLSHTRDTSYIVKLKAASFYCADSISEIIRVYAMPKASFTADTTFGCPPVPVNTSNFSLNTPAEYQWNFGDGFKQKTRIPESIDHIYQNNDSIIRNYNLELKVITDNGCRDSMTMQMQMYPYVTAAFSHNDRGCSPLIVNFTNNSRNADDYYWDLGNGIQSVNLNPIHLYYNPNDNDITYVAKLKAVSRYECTDSIMKNIYVYPSPLAAFYVQPFDMRFDQDTIISVFNQAIHPAKWNYNWNFGDNNTSTTKETIFDHEYEIWGPNSDSNRLYLSVVLENPEHPECRDTSKAVIILKPPRPVAKIVGADSIGCVPLTLSFVIQYNYTYQDSTVWDFGDGVVAKGVSNITHTYDSIGIFYIKLRVVGDGGANYDYQFIEVYPKPIANFDANPTNLLLPNASVQFSNTSFYSSSYRWDFGDGATSTLEDPVHSYTDSGSYTIQFVAITNKGCRDSITRENLIYVDDPGAINFPNAFRPNPSGANGGGYSETDITSSVFRPVWEGVNKSDYLLQIFNRWGERIFETTELNKGWDGYYDGKLCKQDVYIFKVKGVYFNGQAFVKVGTITLLR